MRVCVRVCALGYTFFPKKTAGLFNAAKGFTAIRSGKVGRPPTVTLILQMQNKSCITSVDLSRKNADEQRMPTHGCPDVSPGCVGKECKWRR